MVPNCHSHSPQQQRRSPSPHPLRPSLLRPRSHLSRRRRSPLRSRRSAHRAHPSVRGFRFAPNRHAPGLHRPRRRSPRHPYALPLHRAHQVLRLPPRPHLRPHRNQRPCQCHRQLRRLRLLWHQQLLFRSQHRWSLRQHQLLLQLHLRLLPPQEPLHLRRLRHQVKMIRLRGSFLSREKRRKTTSSPSRMNGRVLRCLRQSHVHRRLIRRTPKRHSHTRLRHSHPRSPERRST